MQIHDWLVQHAQCIESDSPQLDAELLLAQRLGKNRAYLLAFADQLLSENLIESLAKDIELLKTGYPLAYILGTKAFWDMELDVDESTLIPRADTETLIEVAQTLFPADTTARMIDLGTGSGAIAIALSRIFPCAAITATDMSDPALTIARRNAQKWQQSSVSFIKSSWLDNVGEQEFDMIVSNPPYVENDDVHLSQLRYEPITALTSGNDGLDDIKIIIQQSRVALRRNGWLLLEHSYDQGQEVRALLDTDDWQSVETYKDLGSNERVTIAQKMIQQ